MRGKVGPDWQAGKRRYMVHFSTGDAAMRWYDDPLDVGAVIESGRFVTQAARFVALNRWSSCVSGA